MGLLDPERGSVRLPWGRGISRCRCVNVPVRRICRYNAANIAVTKSPLGVSGVIAGPIFEFFGASADIRARIKDLIERNMQPSRSPRRLYVPGINLHYTQIDAVSGADEFVRKRCRL